MRPPVVKASNSPSAIFLTRESLREIDLKEQVELLSFPNGARSGLSAPNTCPGSAVAERRCDGISPPRPRNNSVPSCRPTQNVDVDAKPKGWHAVRWFRARGRSRRADSSFEIPILENGARTGVESKRRAAGHRAMDLWSPRRGIGRRSSKVLRGFALGAPDRRL